jgi:uncharacterized membrane protein YoaK (UPF0700 family)
VLSKPIPRWVLLAGFLLAATAGSVNAVGLLGIHHQALSHLSGLLTALSNEVAGSHGSLALKAAAVIGAFFAGCVLSALLIRHEALQLGRRYGAVLILESACLWAAWWLLRQDRYAGECAAALACGLQNAMASNYSGAVIRTTHMTGMVTDLGIALGQALRGAAVDCRRAGLYGLLLAGFVAGGIGGSYGYFTLGVATLVFPASLTGLAGLAILTVLPRAGPGR